MKERTLLEKSIKPTEETLKEAIQGCYKYYELLVKMTEQFDTKWTFHKGWLKKFFDKKKALFYILPHAGSFTVGMTIRQNEKELMLMDENLSYVHDKLKESEKYNEGYAIDFAIENEKSFKGCEIFISKLIEIRTKKK